MDWIELDLSINNRILNNKYNCRTQFHSEFSLRYVERGICNYKNNIYLINYNQAVVRSAKADLGFQNLMWVFKI